MYVYLYVCVFVVNDSQDEQQ